MLRYCRRRRERALWALAHRIVRFTHELDELTDNLVLMSRIPGPNEHDFVRTFTEYLALRNVSYERQDQIRDRVNARIDIRSAVRAQRLKELINSVEG